MRAEKIKDKVLTSYNASDELCGYFFFFGLEYKIMKSCVESLGTFWKPSSLMEQGCEV
jgi:hypothetical protein